MDPLLKTVLWQQFGATIDMLDNAVLACPDRLWQSHLWNEPPDYQEPSKYSAFWYLTYHCLFWLDFYLTGGGEEEFVPPPPFTRDEFDPAGVVPEQPFSKDTLHAYLVQLRRKCQTTIAELTDEKAHQPINYSWTRGKLVSYLELLLYNLRHVQEHATQLNLFLGQNAVDEVPGWVRRAKADI